MGSFSCNICSFYKEDQEAEVQQTLITKVEESNEINNTKEHMESTVYTSIYKTEDMDINYDQKRLTNISEQKKTPKIKTKKKISKISYLIPESLSKRDNIEKYYQLFPTLIATGGSSKIFLGRNNNGKFAIKQIIKGGVALPEELIREASISLQLNHKNIIKFYEIYEDKTYIYFVMELGDGGDLFDFITCGENLCLSSDISIDILIQILEAVDYLHSIKRIIHRDIKAENFLIKIDENNNPIIKLIDFGLAINMPNNGEKLTEIIGTRKYCSPEMLLGQGYNEKIDEWAIGVVMFSMLTGYEPFRRTGQYQVEESIVFAKIDFEIIQDPDLRILNMKLLERNEANRITCREALEYLKQIKQFREVVYNDNYYKYQRHLFIENYKLMLKEKLNKYELKTI